MSFKTNFNMEYIRKNIREQAENAIKQGKSGATTEIECPHCNQQTNIKLNIEYSN